MLHCTCQSIITIINAKNSTDSVTFSCQFRQCFHTCFIVFYYQYISFHISQHTLCYPISCSKSWNRPLWKNSSSGIFKPSHITLIVTIPVFLLLPFIIFFNVDGGIPALYANCDTFMFLSSQSFLILHTTASCVFTCDSPLYEIISHTCFAAAYAAACPLPYVLSHITRFQLHNRFLYGLCDIFVYFSADTLTVCHFAGLCAIQ